MLPITSLQCDSADSKCVFSARSAVSKAVFTHEPRPEIVQVGHVHADRKISGSSAHSLAVNLPFTVL